MKKVYIEKEFNTVSIPAATQKSRNWQEWQERGTPDSFLVVREKNSQDCDLSPTRYIVYS